MLTRFTAVALLLFLTAPALAIKPYTLVEDGYPEKLGQVELENTFEFDFHTRADSSFKQLNVEHELEWGVTDNFDLRVKGSYFYEDSADLTALHFDAAGVEGQFYFTNPSIDPLGISVLAAAEAGERSLALETVLVVQKDWEKWVATYNLGLATEIEGIFTDGGSSETTGTITNAL